MSRKYEILHKLLSYVGQTPHLIVFTNTLFLCNKKLPPKLLNNINAIYIVPNTVYRIRLKEFDWSRARIAKVIYTTLESHIHMEPRFRITKI